MGLDTIVRNGVALANRLTQPLQVYVTHYTRTGIAGDGTPVFANTVGVLRRALVEDHAGRVVDNGVEATRARTKVTFLVNVTIGEGDEIMLPDGYRGPVLFVDGLADTEGGHYLREVYLGFK